VKSFESFPKILERLLEHNKKLRNNFEKALEQSKGNEKIYSQLVEVYEPIKETELIIIEEMDKLHLHSMKFLKETIEWNDKMGRSNDYLVKKLGQKVVDEALSLKD
tara:strand:+ start:92 stop:409 length:318 start_codon:yes stop_codon:yes gene_type:complete